MCTSSKHAFQRIFTMTDFPQNSPSVHVGVYLYTIYRVFNSDIKYFRSCSICPCTGSCQLQCLSCPIYHFTGSCQLQCLSCPQQPITSPCTQKATCGSNEVKHEVTLQSTRERVHNARHKNVTSALNTTFFKTSEL